MPHLESSARSIFLLVVILLTDGVMSRGKLRPRRELVVSFMRWIQKTQHVHGGSGIVSHPSRRKSGPAGNRVSARASARKVDQ